MKYISEEHKCNIIIASILSIIFISSIIIISVTGAKKSSVLPEGELKQETTINPEENSNTNSESNSNEDNNFSIPLLAPFIDMVSWVDPTSKYSLNGAPDLGVIYDEIGANVYNLGFIRADDNEPVDKDGNIRWGWGGYYKLSEDGNDGYQYEGIKKSIQNVRDRGGDVIVSVGGQLGLAPWTQTKEVDKLKNMYLEIIDAYNLKRIDLDIEEVNQGFADNVINAKAIKKVQDKTGVEVVLTIPIMPYGYTTTQKNLLRAYIGNGVNISLVNNMTMCYGSEVNPGEDFAEASIRACKNSNIQLREIYAEYGVDKTEQETYKMLGATVDIGYENQYNPIFTADMTRSVGEFAKSVNMGMYSYWSLNRDAKIEANKGVNNIYEFYNAATSYLN